MNHIIVRESTAEIRAIARNALKDNWIRVVIGMFVYYILTTTVPELLAALIPGSVMTLSLIHIYIKHTYSRDIAHNFRLLFMRKLSKFPLRRLETGEDILVMFVYQRFKQFFFAFVVSVKGSGCHTYRFDNISQRRVFIALF